jgi:hypoxanthine phosphoribosyltransferase
MPIRELISAATIDSAVTALGEKLSTEYHERPLTVLAVLSGSIMLVADLMRRISVPHQLGVLQASSYRGTATTPGQLHVRADGLPDLSDRDVLLVDDIFDTGRTLEGIVAALHVQRPRSVRSAVLLWKQSRRVVELVPDFYCFSIPDAFVVGYGLDYNGQYRHLPYIGVIEEQPSA